MQPYHAHIFINMQPLSKPKVVRNYYFKQVGETQATHLLRSVPNDKFWFWTSGYLGAIGLKYSCRQN